MIGSAWYYDDHFGESVAVNDPDDLEGISLLVLWGGEDISPALYNQPVVKAHAPDRPSPRDLVEVALANKAIELGIPILGVCRGAQLLCALGGGSLFQHVENHVGGNHSIVYEGKWMTTNSCHHQMMMPTDDMEVLAYTPALSPKKWTTRLLTCTYDEPEIVYFPKMKALGVQGHPEWLSHAADLNKLTKQLTGELLNVDIRG